MCPAAAALRKQALNGVVRSANEINDRARQCGMRIAFTDRIEQRECAHEKIVSRRRQPWPESDQALNGFPVTQWPSVAPVSSTSDNQRSNIAMRGPAMRASGD